MIVTIKDKENISRLVKERKTQFKMSLERVADQVDVNKATVNKLVHADEHWRKQSISDEMWLKFAEWVGYSLTEDTWKVHRGAKNFTRYYNMCKHAREASIMRIISDRFGKGKSTALEAFAKDHETVGFYLKCHKSWTQRVLLAQIKKALKLDGGVQNTFDALEEISAHLEKIKVKKPWIAFDEYNRLPTGSKAQIFSLYEMREGELGIILCGGMNLEKELDNGVIRANQDCQEIHDRAGGKYLSSDALTADQIESDVKAICKLNGITDDKVILAITNNFNGSFRKVKADIDDYKRKLKKGGKNG